MRSEKLLSFSADYIPEYHQFQQAYPCKAPLPFVKQGLFFHLYQKNSKNYLSNRQFGKDITNSISNLLDRNNSGYITKRNSLAQKELTKVFNFFYSLLGSYSNQEESLCISAR